MMVLLVHVDDLLIALREGDAEAEELVVRLVKKLQLKLCRDAEFTFCAKEIVLSKKTIQVSQPKASRDLALFEVSAERKKERTIIRA